MGWGNSPKLNKLYNSFGFAGIYNFTLRKGAVFPWKVDFLDTYDDLK